MAYICTSSVPVFWSCFCVFCKVSSRTVPASTDTPGDRCCRVWFGSSARRVGIDWRGVRVRACLSRATAYALVAAASAANAFDRLIGSTAVQERSVRASELRFEKRRVGGWWLVVAHFVRAVGVLYHAFLCRFVSSWLRLERGGRTLPQKQRVCRPLPAKRLP